MNVVIVQVKVINIDSVLFSRIPRNITIATMLEKINCDGIKRQRHVKLNSYVSLPEDSLEILAIAGAYIDCIIQQICDW